MIRKVVTVCILIGFILPTLPFQGISPTFFFDEEGRPRAIIVVGARATSDEIVAAASIAAKMGSLAQKDEEERIVHTFSVTHGAVLPQEVLFDVPRVDSYSILRHFTLPTLWYFDDSHGIYGNNDGTFQPWESHEELQFRFYDSFFFSETAGFEFHTHRLYFGGRDLPADESLSNRFVPSVVYRMDNIRVPPQLSVKGFRLTEPEPEDDSNVVDTHAQAERTMRIPDPRFVRNGWLPRIHLFDREYTVVSPYLLGMPSFFLEQYLYEGEVREYGGFEVRLVDVDIDHDKAHLVITNPRGRVYDFWMVLDPLHGFSPSPQLASQSGEGEERNGNSLWDVFFSYPSFLLDGIGTFIGAGGSLGMLFNVYTLEDYSRLSNRKCCRPYEEFPHDVATYAYGHPPPSVYSEEYPIIVDNDASETFTQPDILLYGGIPYVGMPPPLTPLRHFGATEVFWDRVADLVFGPGDVIVDDGDGTLSVTAGDVILHWGGASVILFPFPPNVSYHDASGDSSYDTAEPIIQDNDSNATYTPGDLVIVGVPPPLGIALANFAAWEMFLDRNGSLTFDGGDWVVEDGDEDGLMSAGDEILFSGPPITTLLPFPAAVMYWSCDPIDLNNEDEWPPHTANSIGTWYDDVDGDGVADTVYEINYYLCESFEADPCCTKFAFSGVSDHFRLDFEDTLWDDNGNQTIWSRGPDAQPGRAGIDDDADGAVDEADEEGSWGSDDLIDQGDDGLEFETEKNEVALISVKRGITLDPSRIIKTDKELTRTDTRGYNLLLVGMIGTNSSIRGIVRRKMVPDDKSPFDWMAKAGGIKYYTNPFGYGRDIIVVSGPTPKDVRRASQTLLEMLGVPIAGAMPTINLSAEVAPRLAQSGRDLNVSGTVTDVNGKGLAGVLVTVDIVYPTGESFVACDSQTTARGTFSCAYAIPTDSPPGSYYAVVRITIGAHTQSLTIPFTVVS